uniref:Uncharacterized protein n=1 Tax=Glossina austeni TaxID=7395 RepID=A0A1A9V2I9_GLOAU
MKNEMILGNTANSQWLREAGLSRAATRALDARRAAFRSSPSSPPHLRQTFNQSQLFYNSSQHTKVGATGSISPVSPDHGFYGLSNLFIFSCFTIATWRYLASAVLCAFPKLIMLYWLFRALHILCHSLHSSDIPFLNASLTK